jgi:hypothetical protein
MTCPLRSTGITPLQSAPLRRIGTFSVVGCTHLFGPPAEIAAEVRLRAEFGLPISIGVARTKHLAKIASQVAKPDGLVVVDPHSELTFLHDLPVELMGRRPPAVRRYSITSSARSRTSRSLVGLAEGIK